MLAVIAGLIAVTGILIYMVGSKRFSSTVAMLSDKQKQVEDSRKIAGRLVEAQESYEKTRAELGFLETSVSTYAYIPTLLGQIEQLGKVHNLKVCAVRPQQAPPPPVAPIKRTSEDLGAAPDSSSSASKSTDSITVKPYEELRIGIEFEGSYWNIHDFMQSLTQFPKIIAVKEIRVSPVNAIAHRGSPNLSVNLVVTAFVFKPDDIKQSEDDRLTTKSVNTSAILNGRSSNEG